MSRWSEIFDPRAEAGRRYLPRQVRVTRAYLLCYAVALLLMISILPPLLIALRSGEPPMFNPAQVHTGILFGTTAVGAVVAWRGVRDDGVHPRLVARLHLVTIAGYVLLGLALITVVVVHLTSGDDPSFLFFDVVMGVVILGLHFVATDMVAVPPHLQCRIDFLPPR